MDLHFEDTLFFVTYQNLSIPLRVAYANQISTARNSTIITIYTGSGIAYT